MTLPATPNIERHDGNDTTGPWAYPYRYISNDHIVVHYRDGQGNESVLTPGVDYTLTSGGPDDPNGAVFETVNPLPTGHRIAIEAQTPPSQDTTPDQLRTFREQAFENALDVRAMSDRRVLDDVNRALVKSPLDAPGQMKLLNPTEGFVVSVEDENTLRGDAVSLEDIVDASDFADRAEAAATAAEASETAAAGSASAAATSATNAANSATAAAGSATDAANSATDAANEAASIQGLITRYTPTDGNTPVDDYPTGASINDIGTGDPGWPLPASVGGHGWTWRSSTFRHTQMVAGTGVDDLWYRNSRPDANGGHRPWQELLNRKKLERYFVDAREYGLVEGNNAGNSQAIVDAMAAADALRTGNASVKVLIPPGDYTFPVGMTCPYSYMTIEAYGALLRFNDTDGIFFRCIQPNQGFTWRGGWIIGDNTPNRGLWISGNDPVIQDVRVDGFKAEGILVGGDVAATNRPRVFDNFINNNNGIGIGFSKCNRVLACRNIIRNSGFHAMTMDNIGSDFNICADNIMDVACTIAGTGVLATDDSSDLLVIGNQIVNGSTWGIRTPNNVDNVDGMHIIGNIIRGNASGGIRLLRNDDPADAPPGPYGCTNCYISGNVIVENGPAGTPPIQIDDFASGSPNKIGDNYYKGRERDIVAPNYTLGLPMQFMVRNTVALNDVTGNGDFYTVPYNDVVFDTTGGALVNGIFTATQPGPHHFDAGVMVRSLNTSHSELDIRLVATGKPALSSKRHTKGVAGVDGNQISGMFDLEVGDTVRVQIRVLNDTKTVDISNTDVEQNYFCGRRISAL